MMTKNNPFDQEIDVLYRSFVFSNTRARRRFNYTSYYATRARARSRTSSATVCFLRASRHDYT